MLIVNILLGACIFLRAESSPISITLPPDEVASKEHKLLLQLDDESHIFLNGELLSETELKLQIQESQQTQQKLVCIIEVSPSVLYEEVINIMDILKQEGVENIVIATTPQ